MGDSLDRSSERTGTTAARPSPQDVAKTAAGTATTTTAATATPPAAAAATLSRKHNDCVPALRDGPNCLVGTDENIGAGNHCRWSVEECSLGRIRSSPRPRDRLL